MVKLSVGPTINKGLTTTLLPFAVDNDAFPTLLNAYQWRGRAKRKRGTTLIGQLTRFISGSAGTFSVVVGANSFSIFSQLGLSSSEPNASIKPGNLSTITITFAAPINNTLTDSTGTGTMVVSGAGPVTAASINYATGIVTITSSGIAGPATVTITANYFPMLPVMGLEDLILQSTQFSSTLGFDTKYSYNISPLYPYSIYDVSWYKNPTTSGLPGTYVQKIQSNFTPVTWNGQNYQQFWTLNYEGALFATNGIKFGTGGIPDLTVLGMQYAASTTTTKTNNVITFNSATATTITVTITNSPLVIGDFVYAAEWSGGTGLNNQAGYVTASSDNTLTPSNRTLTITFPDATITDAGLTPGILQYLTNRSNTAIDCIRWYDGDPTNGGGAPSLSSGDGWVNFMPPLSNLNYEAAELPPDRYYLVGGRLMAELQDRLLIFGPVVQNSAGLIFYVQSGAIFSWNGTPYYTSSYTNDPSPTIDNPFGPIYTNLIPLLVPVNQNALPPAWFENNSGFGGNKVVNVPQQIVTVSPNEDQLIVEFTQSVYRFVYTGNDINPFNFFITNSEYGCGSTFSVINMDDYILSRGKRGFIAANQVEVTRFDLDILDQAFEISLKNNGSERVTAQRDFVNEWIYFTYPSNGVAWSFPNQTLFYNYRDKSWGVFDETYTTYGSFRPQSGFIWSDLTTFHWQDWNEPWNAGSSDDFEQFVIAGNQQGFVIKREDSITSEDLSLAIQSFNTNLLTVPNHCLNTGDFIIISGCIGTIGAIVNGNIYEVSVTTGTDQFYILPLIGTGTYFGGGYITRLYKPLMQTRQFPLFDTGKKVRIGPQQYLLTKTPLGQITLQIYLSQDAANAYNEDSSTLDPFGNGSLIYTNVLYTCPESTNLGLTPLNTNLQMLTYVGSAPNDAGTSPSAQIWHRVNTSLIGDTVQLGFTLSDVQMNDINSNQSEIELHGFNFDVSTAGYLA